MCPSLSLLTNCKFSLSVSLFVSFHDKRWFLYCLRYSFPYVRTLLFICVEARCLFVLVSLASIYVKKIRTTTHSAKAANSNAK